MLPSFWEMFVFILLTPYSLSYFLLICILSLYRTPVLHPVTKLKPSPSRFLCDERASEFQFPTSSVTLELSYFSFFILFPLPGSNGLHPPLFFSRLLAYFLHILHLTHFIYRAQIFAPT